MISVQVKSSSLASVKKIMSDLGFNVRKELAVAVNKASDKTKSKMVKSIKDELITTQAVMKQAIGTKGKASEQSIETTIVLKKEKRLPLKEFKPTQNKTGVTYKISKTKGRKTIAGAFQGPRPGVMKRSWKGNVFKRLGKKRLPIAKLFGPSVWGVFVVKKLEAPTTAEAQKELIKQVQERIRFLTLKAQGKLRGKQK